ncbi:hypothetical protein L7F22_062105 [Adiantum nelumboides]|nr:hypothetical protein [Adiantum nelumboides]
MATIRTVIAVAAAKGRFMHQMDVKNAFLQRVLQEEVYVEQPPGYEDGKHPHYVWRLCKTLYGLKQAPRAWHDKIIEYLLRIGFCMSHVDHSLYVRHSDARFVLITIYVDDLIIVGDSETKIDPVKGLLKKEFEMKDLGELRYVLRLEVIRRQRAYGCLRDSMHWICYSNMVLWIVGSLIYLTIAWPDLSYIVGLQSHFMQLPRKPHLDALHHTLRYVRATLDHALFYATDILVQLHGYTDVDWVGSSIDRRSTSGFMFTLSSAAITWSSKKQPTVALSSKEAEYRGAAIAACEVAWLHKLLMDLRLLVDKEVFIYCDKHIEAFIFMHKPST